MRLLIITQTLDLTDPVLGFFHRWVEALAPKTKNILVICLKKGTYQLPKNVRVISLGKENGGSTITYAMRFLSSAWRERKEYDSVFVHMNQEYLLLGGLLWKALGKKAYLWRNHYAGSWLTDIAAFFCIKVFCTSKYSYTAKYKKTVFMPVGVDTKVFSPVSTLRHSSSILFLARMSPSKRPDMLIEAMHLLKQRNIPFSATMVGSPSVVDETYYSTLKARTERLGLTEVHWQGGIENHETSALYRSHEIFVNCSPSGMFDKTIFEAASSGCLSLAASKDWAELAGPGFHFTNAADLAAHIEALQKLSTPDKEEARHTMIRLGESHALTRLAQRLAEELNLHA